MLVYNYGNEDGEGASLPVWVGCGGEAATITLAIMKLTCENLEVHVFARVILSCHVFDLVGP